jgi:hypothetical protein
MKTPKTITLMVTLCVPLLLGSCSNKGSAEQKKKFEEAVALESQTRSIPSRVSAYMEVVTIDPGSETGKAARERVEQLSKEMEALNTTLR